ncbi:MAG: hypothetical protein ACYCZR_03010, partial [Burkholderiales bacterium]
QDRYGYGRQPDPVQSGTAVQSGHAHALQAQRTGGVDPRVGSTDTGYRLACGDHGVTGRAFL